MKPLPVLLLLIILSHGLYAQDCGCDHTIEPKANGQAFCANPGVDCPITYAEKNNITDVKPGDVICIKAGTYPGYLDFYNLLGTKEEPIIIKNCGGKVIINAIDSQDGMDFWNSNDVHITGTGDPSTFYGIRVNGGQNGIRLNHVSINYEVDHIEIYDSGNHGLDLKNDPDCRDERSLRSGNYPNERVSVHDIYVDGTKYEGFYIGDSHYNITVPGTGCTENVEEQSVLDVEVYNCIVKNNGWDGIQVGSVIGQARIYNNRVEDYGLLLNNNDQAGFQINPGTKAVMYNNIALNGSGTAYFINGDGLEMYNNISYNSLTALSVFAKLTSPDSKYIIYNNTFLQATFTGLSILPASFTIPSNQFYNNIVHYTPNNCKQCTDDPAYRYKIEFAWNEENDQNNIYTTDLSSLKFVDPDNYNYRLTTESTLALDLGDCSPFANMVADFDGYARDYNAACDIGAFEYTIPSVTFNEQSIDFPLNSNEIKNYTLTGSYLRSNIKIPVPDNFSISTDPDNFEDIDTLYIDMDHINSINTTVYVKFSPNGIGEFSEQLIHITDELGEKSLKLTGEYIVLSTKSNLDGVKVYPNPVNDEHISLHIDLGKHSSKSTTMIMIDASGKEYLRRQSTEQTFSMDIPSTMTSGLYFVKVIIDNKQELIQKVYIN
ncbi:T9SS type A sorting domain-containing protein [Reichenbachiella agarivorans]|uniref:T9SS type A sorting domain-containing protein n=1 Tax=Reichenbachiella agarivorans TaxID=2979464 RepID=A0ABY6CQW9_9BACT|nr:T9SS type A sorting domain-containing protein [Reichenbachiella agarivorans]UXP32425.1 T9SS type A sorting domain-containing protein [Reichenbachiella agarivorans]